MGRSRNLCARRVFWLASALVAFALVSGATTPTPPDTQDSLSVAAETSLTPPHDDVVPAVTHPSSQSDEKEAADAARQQELDQAAEASRAYKQALATLTTLSAYPPSFTFDPSMINNANSKSILAAFLPNLQGQGPIGSTLRIILKLHHQIVRRLGGALGLGQETIGIGSKRKDEEQRLKAIKVLDLLEHSAELGNTDALYTLAKVSLFPPTQHFPLDAKRAYNTFSTVAAQTGSASAQAFLGFFHATGYGDIVPSDQAKAQLYFTFAANGGDKSAQMALAYRYWSGIGTSDSCEGANAWYGSAAEQAMRKFLSGPPGGRTLPQTPTRLSDLTGGIYGPGASVASSGFGAQRPAIKAGVVRAAGETWEDVIDYYMFNADRGEIDFAYRLGKIYHQGSIYASPGGIGSGSEGVGAIPRNYGRARHYFLQIARQVWPQDPPHTIQMKDDHKLVSYAAACAGYLGRMFLRGEGVKQDFTVARMWFERGSTHGDRESQNGLGIIYRDGLGVKANVKTAYGHFLNAAAQDLAEAQVNLGKHHYFQNEVLHATPYFEAAIRNGSPFEAYYYLAEIQAAQALNPSLPSEIISSSCSMAVSFYKIVAERGVWEDNLLAEAERAWMSNTEQGRETAMIKWWVAAERGFEIAQNNLAYVLDQDKSMLRLTRFAPNVPSNHTARLALTQWTRAAGQRNIDALVKVGDYYYQGLGVSADEGERSRLEKAISYYQSAADTHLSALAMWNLGWMYENGVGVQQDFHLAKRHYDSALDISSDAYVPVMLSLFKLYVRSFWHTLRGGKGGLNLWTSDEEDKEFIARSKEARAIGDGPNDNRRDTGIQEDEEFDNDDGNWYMGKAKEDFQKRQSNPDHRSEDEDPVQWARDRRNAEQDRDSYFGPEDYFDGAMRNGRIEEAGDDIDDLFETMMLVALCLLVSVLLYIRTRMVERMRREQQQQQQQPQQPPQQQPQHPAANGNHRPAPVQEGGLFPPPDDPARNEWAILR